MRDECRDNGHLFERFRFNGRPYIRACVRCGEKPLGMDKLPQDYFAAEPEERAAIVSVEEEWESESNAGNPL